MMGYLECLLRDLKETDENVLFDYIFREMDEQICYLRKTVRDLKEEIESIKRQIED